MRHLPGIESDVPAAGLIPGDIVSPTAHAPTRQGYYAYTGYAYEVVRVNQKSVTVRRLGLPGPQETANILTQPDHIYSEHFCKPVPRKVPVAFFRALPALAKSIRATIEAARKGSDHD